MQFAVNHIYSELQGLYPDTEIKSFCNLIFEKLLGYSRTQLIINKNTLCSEEQHDIIKSFIQQLKAFVPIQYVLGETVFYGLTFNVNESVLIPRPETEELVDWIQNDNDNNASLHILDIGTGSGCIAISLKQLFANARMDGFDISDMALATATDNSKRNKLDVELAKIDILNPPTIDKQWDIIVSNPPYVLEKEKATIHPNVLQYEPHLALFVPNDDPLLFYRNIAIFAQQHLSPNGKLYFEVNRAFGNSVVALLSAMKFCDVELKKDIAGNDRMVRAILLSKY